MWLHISFTNSHHVCVCVCVFVCVCVCLCVMGGREVIAERDKTIVEKERLVSDLRRQAESIGDKLKVRSIGHCYHGDASTTHCAEEIIDLTTRCPHRDVTSPQGVLTVR